MPTWAQGAIAAVLTAAVVIAGVLVTRGGQPVPLASEAPTETPSPTDPAIADAVAQLAADVQADAIDVPAELPIPPEDQVDVTLTVDVAHIDDQTPLSVAFPRSAPTPLGDDGTADATGHANVSSLATASTADGEPAALALVPKGSATPVDTAQLTYLSTGVSLLFTQPGWAIPDPDAALVLHSLAASLPEADALADVLATEAVADAGYLTAPTPARLDAVAALGAALLARLDVDVPDPLNGRTFNKQVAQADEDDADFRVACDRQPAINADGVDSLGVCVGPLTDDFDGTVDFDVPGAEYIPVLATNHLPRWVIFVRDDNGLPAGVARPAAYETLTAASVLGAAAVEALDEAGDRAAALWDDVQSGFCRLFCPGGDDEPEQVVFPPPQRDDILSRLQDIAEDRLEPETTPSVWVSDVDLTAYTWEPGLDPSSLSDDELVWVTSTVALTITTEIVMPLMSVVGELISTGRSVKEALTGPPPEQLLTDAAFEAERTAVTDRGGLCVENPDGDWVPAAAGPTTRTILLCAAASSMQELPDSTRESLVENILAGDVDNALPSIGDVTLELLRSGPLMSAVGRLLLDEAAGSVPELVAGVVARFLGGPVGAAITAIKVASAARTAIAEGATAVVLATTVSDLVAPYGITGRYRALGTYEQEVGRGGQIAPYGCGDLRAFYDTLPEEFQAEMRGVAPLYVAMNVFGLEINAVGTGGIIEAPTYNGNVEWTGETTDGQFWVDSGFDYPLDVYAIEGEPAPEAYPFIVTFPETLPDLGPNAHPLRCDPNPAYDHSPYSIGECVIPEECGTGPTTATADAGPVIAPLRSQPSADLAVGPDFPPHNELIELAGRLADLERSGQNIGPEWNEIISAQGMENFLTGFHGTLDPTWDYRTAGTCTNTEHDFGALVNCDLPGPSGDNAIDAVDRMTVVFAFEPDSNRWRAAVAYSGFPPQ